MTFLILTSIVFSNIVVIPGAFCAEAIAKALTDNINDDENPQIHNGQVVWVGLDGPDDEIFLYDGLSTIQLTNNSKVDDDPQIHNGQVTWRGRGIEGSMEIFLYDGSSTIQLTHTSE